MKTSAFKQCIFVLCITLAFSSCELFMEEWPEHLACRIVVDNRSDETLQVGFIWEGDVVRWAGMPVTFDVLQDDILPHSVVENWVYGNPKKDNWRGLFEYWGVDTLKVFLSTASWQQLHWRTDPKDESLLVKRYDFTLRDLNPDADTLTIIYDPKQDSQ